MEYHTAVGTDSVADSLSVLLMIPRPYHVTAHQ